MRCCRALLWGKMLCRSTVYWKISLGQEPHPLPKVLTGNIDCLSLRITVNYIYMAPTHQIYLLPLTGKCWFQMMESWRTVAVAGRDALCCWHGHRILNDCNWRWEKTANTLTRCGVEQTVFRIIETMPELLLFEFLYSKKKVLTWTWTARVKICQRQSRHVSRNASEIQSRFLVGSLVNLSTSALPIWTSWLPVICPATWCASAGVHQQLQGHAAMCASLRCRRPWPQRSWLQDEGHGCG